MRPGPKKPGESAAEYNARIKEMEQRWMSGGRPKTSSGSPRPGTGGTSPKRDMGPGSGLAPKPGDRSDKMRAASEKAASQKESQMRMRAASEKAASQKDSQMKLRAAAERASEMKARGSSRGTSPAPGYGGGKPVMRAKGGMVKGKKC